MPSDAAASLQLLALWLPMDSRLLWQVGEMAGAHGDVATAAAILDGCVLDFNLRAPELLDHRLASYGGEHRMVFGARTFRQFVSMLASSTEESEVRDPWVTEMRNLPATVVSTTLEGPLDWPDATVVSGNAVDIVARLKEQSEVPLRSHGILSMNWALMAAGLVDRVQVTLFPVITSKTGTDPIFGGAADFDLELIDSRTLDGRTQELIYRPTLHAPKRGTLA